MYRMLKELYQILIVDGLNGKTRTNIIRFHYSRYINKCLAARRNWRHWGSSSVLSRIWWQRCPTRTYGARACWLNLCRASRINWRWMIEKHHWVVFGWGGRLIDLPCQWSKETQRYGFGQGILIFPEYLLVAKYIFSRASQAHGALTTDEALFRSWSSPRPRRIMDWVWRRYRSVIRQCTVIKPLYEIFPLLNPPTCTRKSVTNIHKTQAQLTTKRSGKKETLNVSDYSPQGVPTTNEALF